MTKNIFLQWKKFATIPLIENTKKPRTKHGLLDAKFNADIERYIFSKFNIGVACEKSNLFVIDVDFHDENSTAMEDLHKLEKKLGKLPRTLTQATPTGNGRHYIFSSKGIINPPAHLGKFIDLKYRGYFVAAPSCIDGKHYQIIDGVEENENFIIADVPETWVEYINSLNATTKNKEKSCKNSHKSYTTQKSKPKIYKNLNIERMFNTCAFLQYCEDNAEVLKEPQWHSMVTVLAQMENSDELIHKLSEPYPKYTFEETQKKIDKAREFGHSQSCPYISGKYPEICGNCKSSNNK